MDQRSVISSLNNFLGKIGHDRNATECLGGEKACWCGPTAKTGRTPITPSLHFGGDSWKIHSDCHRCAIVQYIKLLQGGAIPSLSVGEKGGQKLGFTNGADAKAEALTNMQIYLEVD